MKPQKDQKSATIKGKAKKKEIISDVPGPGKYNATRVEINHEEFPKWTIPSKYPNQEPEIGPGPGQYVNLHPKDKGIGITMKSRYPNTEKVDDVPGPGYYITKSQLETNGVTIVGRTKVIDKENLAPGPGMYNIKDEESNPKWSIQGKNLKHDRSDPTPGPAHYSNPDYEEKGVAYSMKGRHIIKQKDENPGPGNYNVKAPKGHDGFTLKGKIKRKEEINENPGPGNYNAPRVEVNHEQFPKWTIPSKYNDPNPDVCPGPGHYANVDLPNKGKGITIQQRYDKNEKVDDLPGPGQYNTRVTPGHPGVTIGERHDENTGPNQVPGPGNYNINSSQSNPKWTIKGRHPNAEFDPTPGPGHYRNPDYDGEGVAYTIKGRNEANHKDENPGPGQYNTRIPTKDGITMGKKIAKKEKMNTNPGPGNYNSKSMLSHISYKIGNGNRSKLTKSDVPGPGSYNDKRKGNQYRGRFGTSKRTSAKKLDVPGPGTYNIHAPKGPEGPKIQKRYPDHDRNDRPGPSHYLIGDDKYKGPAFTIGEKRRRRSLDDFPAPNHYLHDDEHVRNNSPRCIFGRSGRKTKIERNNLGPGLYNHKSHISDGPSHFIGRRYAKSLTERTPGPGQYNIDTKRPKSAQSNMSRSQRLTTADNSVPGPGKYNVTNDSGRSISFSRSRRRGTSTPKTPGPGSYHIPTWDDDTGRTILERHEKIQKENYPGPGMYDIKLPTGLSYSISGTDALDYGLKERMNNPPPNSYLIEECQIKDRTIGGDIGKSEDKSTRTQFPGPGHYTVYDVNAKAKGVTIGEKHELNRDNKFPGPGHYSNRIIKFETPSYSVGKGNRSDLVLGDAPGPGSYKLEEEYDKGRTIPKATNNISTIDENVPGPGYYSDLYKHDLDGHGVTIGIKFPETDKEVFPGPGQYKAKKGSQGPAYTISKKKKQT